MEQSWAKIISDYDQIQKELQDPNIAGNLDVMKNLGKKLSKISPVAEKIITFQRNEKQIEENKILMEDAEFRELATQEIEKLTSENETLEKDIIELLVEKDPDDEKDAIVEIRAGTGGEEAALFAGDLLNMLFRFSERKGFKTEMFDKNETENGGIKDITFAIRGNGAYGELKYESGVHRVQRVPKTEAKGRLHTSAASIFIYPETEASEFDVPESDLRFETFRSSGPGGQSVNTTDSAVRIVHIPTGTIVTCQDEKSQHKNKARALSIMRARLAELAKQKIQDEANAGRKEAIRTGDRSEKIRTWNFPQDRMTDHRIKQSFFGIKNILDGDLDGVIESFRKIAKNPELISDNTDLDS